MRRRFALLVSLLTTLMLSGVTPAHAAGWHQVFADGFNTPVKVGSFRDCDHSTDTKQAYCGGLTGSVRANWWAYPNSWGDTATQRSYDVGGMYHPEDTVWISPSQWGDGQMHIRMYRPANGGPVHSATLVPKPLMGQRYGRYEERFRVVHPRPGFKSAHLLWPNANDGCSEIDYPENSWDTTINAFTHPSDCSGQDSFDTGVSWTSWHTSVIEWRPGSITYYLDGKQAGHSTHSVPSTPMNWDIQNESSLDGESAAPGSWSQMDITYVRGYSYS